MIENLPDGWRVEKLGKCVDILDNLRIPLNNQDRENRIKNKDISSLYPYYGATQQVGYIDDYIFDEELVLLGEDGVMFYDKNKPKAYLIGGKSWVNNHAHVLRAKSEVTMNKYLLNYLNTFHYKGFVSGATRLKLNQSRMAQIPVPIPPLPQQERIVKVLDISSALIAKQKELIKNYDLFLKSKFIEMFGDPIKNSFAWEVVKLGKYGTLARGKSAHRPRNAPFLYGGIYPFIQTGDITKGNSIYLKKYKQTYSEDGIKQSRLFLKDTIAITIAANIGDTKILGFDCYFPDSVVGFNVERPLFVSSLFCYYKLKLEQQATKTAQKNINLKVLNNLDVIHPPITLQNKFASIVEKTELIKEKENKKLKSLQTLHDSLMQKAFKGEIG